MQRSLYLEFTFYKNMTTFLFEKYGGIRISILGKFKDSL